MKQEKKEKIQVGDTVIVKGSYIGTVTHINPFWVCIKPDANELVSHCRIIPPIDRRPTLRQKIGLWWYDLSRQGKTGVALTAINAAIAIMWLTIFITR